MSSWVLKSSILSSITWYLLESGMSSSLLPPPLQLTGCDDGLFSKRRGDGSAAQLYSSRRAGWDICYWWQTYNEVSFIAQPLTPHPHPRLSWAGIGFKHTPVLSLVSQFFRERGATFGFSLVLWTAPCLFSCRDKVAVILLPPSLTWRQRSTCRCPKVMYTRRRR